MKTLVSLVLGAAMLFGAATFGARSGSASARENWHHHHRHHHRHYHRNRLSW